MQPVWRDGKKTVLSAVKQLAIAPKIDKKIMPEFLPKVSIARHRLCCKES
jgi:hypothetical protein